MSKLFLAILFLLLTPNAAKACECIMASSIEGEIKRVKAVFVARVDKQMKNGKWTNQFEILDAWKGFATRSNMAWQPIIVEQNSCNYQFEEGRVYLIFADTVFSGNGIDVTTCSMTKPASKAGNVLKILGNPETSYIINQVR